MVQNIDRDEVQRLMAQGAQIVDVLPAREYGEDHLPGPVADEARGHRGGRALVER